MIKKIQHFFIFHPQESEAALLFAALMFLLSLCFNVGQALYHKGSMERTRYVVVAVDEAYSQAK